MFNFSNPQPPSQEREWQNKIDQFAHNHQTKLAALAWGTYQEQEQIQEGKEAGDILGIDLKPTPHFVNCPRKSLEKLNLQVNGLLQEIIGIINGYKPEEEVVMIAIGEGQIKLINFAPELPPPDCFDSLGKNTYTLRSDLEELLREIFN